MWLGYAEAVWLNLDATPPLRPALESFREPRHLAALVIFLHTVTLAIALDLLFALAVLDRLLRVRWLVVIAWAGAFMAVSWPDLVAGSDWRIDLQAALVQALIAAMVLARLGPVALAAMLFTVAMLTRSPAALEFSAWYSIRSLIALAIVLGMALYAARISAGFTFRRPALADR